MRCQIALPAFLLATAAPIASLTQPQALSPDVAGTLAATTVEQVVVTANRSAVRYADQSFDNNETSVVLKAYTLVDLRASYPLRENMGIYARVENLTNKAYETTYQFGTLGRAGYGGVRLSF